MYDSDPQPLNWGLRMKLKIFPNTTLILPIGKVGKVGKGRKFVNRITIPKYRTKNQKKLILINPDNIR